jgi:catechol 2,3-dioxygenase-like lactoylglutathione lyase family enzyme
LAVASLNSIVPCFIVENLQASLDFYQSKLGFEIAYKGGGNGDDDGEDFWAFVRRDCVMVSFKAIAPEIHPQPNHSRHEWARWDAYIHTSDPDSLYQEYVSRSVPMHKPLADTEDGLRAFEVIDNNGYVLCFGKPRGEPASVREPSRREILDELAKREFRKGDCGKVPDDFHGGD